MARRLWLLPFMALVLFPGSASAGNLKMTATLVATCTITGSTLAFGAYDPLSPSPLDVTANALTIACTRGDSNVAIALDNGLNHKKATAGMTRAMSATGSGPYLSYDLYTNVSHTTVWNNSNRLSYTPLSMAAAALAVYGLVPAGQDPGPGTYTDSVTATVHF